jgi:ATP-dependent Clp protease protease subunit
MRRKKKVIPQTLDINKELKVDDILLKHRTLFLTGEIKTENIIKLIKDIFLLDALNKKPIKIYINSPGGSVSDGFALIDSIKLIKSPITTIIIGEACSMAGLISIVGKDRYITKNAVWMGHDMSGGVKEDYSGKVEYRIEFIKKLWKTIENHLKTYTKLTNEEIQILRNGEMWLSPEECLTKGIVDKIF